jgi:hypothetical protein
LTFYSPLQKKGENVKKIIIVLCFSLSACGMSQQQIRDLGHAMAGGGGGYAYPAYPSYRPTTTLYQQQPKPVYTRCYSVDGNSINCYQY